MHDHRTFFQPRPKHSRLFSPSLTPPPTPLSELQFHPYLPWGPCNDGQSWSSVRWGCQYFWRTRTKACDSALPYKDHTSSGDRPYSSLPLRAGSRGFARTTIQTPRHLDYSKDSLNLRRLHSCPPPETPLRIHAGTTGQLLELTSESSPSINFVVTHSKERSRTLSLTYQAVFADPRCGIPVSREAQPEVQDANSYIMCDRRAGRDRHYHRVKRAGSGGGEGVGRGGG